MWEEDFAENIAVYSRPCLYRDYQKYNWFEHRDERLSNLQNNIGEEREREARRG